MSSRRPSARWRPVLELLVLIVALAADLWWLRRFDSPVPRMLAQATIVLVIAGSIARRHRAGVRSRPAPVSRLRGWGEPLVFTALAALALAAVGAYLRTEPYDEVRLFALGWSLGDQVRAAMSAVAHALMQQAALLGLVWPTSREIFRDRRPAYLVSAAIFGAAHLPHLGLAATTFAVACVWLVLYRRGASVAALILSHAVLAPWAYGQLPERTLHDLHVGRKAANRAVNYRMLEIEENRRLLRRVCSPGYVDRFGGSETEYTRALFDEVLDREPTANELRRWTERVRRRTHCSMAKMLVMSDESVARWRAAAESADPQAPR